MWRPKATTKKEKTASLQKSIMKVKDKIIIARSEGNKRALDALQAVLAFLEAKLEETKKN